MLGSHSKALSMTELRSFVIGGRKPFRCKTCHSEDCPVWTHELTKKLVSIGPSHEIYKLIGKQSGKQILIDSSKIVGDWFSKTLIGLNPQDVLCIHISKAPEEYGGSERNKSHYTSLYNVADIGNNWWRSNTDILRYLSNVPYESVSIRYRDLVDNPEPVLSFLLSKIGLDYETGMEKFWNYEHHPLWGNKGTRSHLDGTDSSPEQWLDESQQNKQLYLRKHQTLFRDEKWRQIFTHEEIDRLYSYGRCAKIAHLLGYAHPYSERGIMLNTPIQTWRYQDVFSGPALKQEFTKQYFDILNWKPVDFLTRRGGRNLIKVISRKARQWWRSL